MTRAVDPEIRRAELAIQARRDWVNGRRFAPDRFLAAASIELKAAKRVERISGAVSDLLVKGAVYAADNTPLPFRIKGNLNGVLTLTVPDGSVRFELDRVLRTGLGDKVAAAGSLRKIRVEIDGSFSDPDRFERPA